MPLHTMIRNQSMGNLEWNNYVANISVEPISLIERGRRLPSVNKEEEGWARVRKFREKTSWMRVETNCGVGKERKSINPHHIVMYGPQTPQTCECSLFLRVLGHQRSWFKFWFSEGMAHERESTNTMVRWRRFVFSRCLRASCAGLEVDISSDRTSRNNMSTVPSHDSDDYRSIYYLARPTISEINRLCWFNC